jgi:NADH-quinone oxidoreductase subunit M
MNYEKLVLSFLAFWPLVGFLIVIFLPKGWEPTTYRKVAWYLSLPTVLVSALLIIPLNAAGWGREAGGPYTVCYEWFRVGPLAVNYAMFVDGLSLPLIVLTALLTTLVISYSNITDRAREYYALFLLLEVGMMGTFVAADFFLFYVFWEISLVPMYFIIGIWGGSNREYAAIKFFLYTLVGSVAMLLAFIWIYLMVPQKTLLFVPNIPGQSSLIGQTALMAKAQPVVALMAFWGIFLAFAIKVPTWPFHTWLPDAHTEAPTGGSVILAGVLLKMGGYGMLRILLPLLPDQSYQMRYVLLVMAVVGVVYGAFVAMAQSDLKKLIAYSSVNHMGFVMMGIASAAAILFPEHTDIQIGAAQTATAGAIYQMFAHGLLTSGLFLLVGIIYDRTHTRELTAFRGLGSILPEYGGFFRLFVFGSLGLPGLAGFVAEFLVFMGTFSSDPAEPGEPLFFRVGTVIAGLGIVITAAFLLWTIQRVLLGPLNPRWSRLPDLEPRERLPLVVLGGLSLVFGLLPNLLLMTMGGYLNSLPGLVVREGLRTFAP